MQVIRYEAHNVMGVKDVKFDLAGRHLFLVGGANGQGKSSALRALVMALAGKSGMQDYPEIALRKGEKKGKVSISLKGDSGDESITVELSLRQKASGEIVEDFRVLDSDGKKTNEPRKLLQQLFTLRAFDPLAFERMPPKEKATLVQKMLGVDLSVFDREYKKVFEKRTDLTRDGKRLAAQLEGAGKKYEDVPAEEIKVADLMAELDRLHADNTLRANAIALGDKLKLQRQELSEQVDSLVKHIANLQKQLGITKQQIIATDNSISELREGLDKQPDRTADIAVVKEKIAKADDINAKIRANREWDKLDSEVKAFRGEYQKLTDRLKEIQDDRAEAVAKAKWPIKGMELNEDGLLMNGLPFEQSSTSQRIMASVAVGMALNPKLRLLVCQHGSELDNETLDALEKVVKENDFQLLIELVTRSKEDEERCAVIIADGEVVGAESPDKDEFSGEDDDTTE